MFRPESIRRTRWQLGATIPQEARRHLNHIHPILGQILYNRGLQEPADVQAFLDGHYLESDDPFLLPGMQEAVERIALAIERNETIVVYGDFDADGVTATVLLTEALRGLGLERRQVRPYIPDRVDEGYGLNIEAMQSIRESGASLMITVDCGIRSVAEVAHANALGLDVIITDHHSLGKRMPDAVAVINPKRVDSLYPDQMLAGVGIAYKLAQALAMYLPEQAHYSPENFLDLVAVGTVADLAPLHHENRRLVSDGLVVLNRLERPGLSALAKISGLRPGSITAESIGFALGPRINAAGRLEHAYSAARLLAANNELSAGHLAEELNALNRRRQQLTAELSEMAEQMVEPQDLILIAQNEAFQAGVVGLVASRLAEKHYRPTIIIEHGDTISRASCRSIPEFNITAALDEVADLLVRHGGHAQAAGFTINNENLAAFCDQMQTIAARDLADVQMVPAIDIDAEISLRDVDWALHEVLALLEPTGQGNPAPVFMSRNVEVLSHRVVGQQGTHLQLQLRPTPEGNSTQPIAAIAFRQGEWAPIMPRLIDVVYTISLNEWNGRKSLQLVVKDLRPATDA